MEQVEPIAVQPPMLLPKPKVPEQISTPDSTIPEDLPATVDELSNLLPPALPAKPKPVADILYV